MLAKAAGHLLPPLTPLEQIDVTKMNSLITTSNSASIERPFRAPHHSVSLAHLVGNNLTLLPGELSLANHGILFLDEFPEFSRQAIEALRTPLEDHQVTLNRLGEKITYPADFMLIAAMNPCPCGYYGTGIKECVCSSNSIKMYRKKLSGPILDRIDMTLMLDSIDTSVLLKTTTFSTQQDASAKRQILAATKRQYARFRKNTIFNSALSSVEIAERLKLTDSARLLLNDASKKLQLSARAYFKTIKVAQTIADLDGCPVIDEAQIAEAICYRHPL